MASSRVASDELVTAAEVAAYQAKPKIYHLVNKNKDPDQPLRFNILGCQGNGSSEQLKVAAFMKEMSSFAENRPDFTLALGDTFYNNGVTRPDDPVFVTQFEAIYPGPTFAILGNHDEALHRTAYMQSETGVARGMHQVAHTYYPRSGRSTDDFKTLYQSHSDTEIIELDIENLPTWNMPSRYYALLIGDSQIFCIDSNTYVEDHFESILHPGVENQATWLKREVEKAKDAKHKVMLALHHPLITPGKRAYENDADIYLSQALRTNPLFQKVYQHQLEDKVKGTFAAYNLLLREAFVQQALMFDCVMTAHDHALYYLNTTGIYAENPICQITAGGGGGDLQGRECFDQEFLGCYLKRYGFVQVTTSRDKPHIEFKLRTLPTLNDLQFTLHFTSESSSSIRYFPPHMSAEEKHNIETLCGVVKKAIERYFEFLSRRQTEHSGGFLRKSRLFGGGGNSKHGEYGVNRAHEVWAYISQDRVDSFLDTARTIRDLTKWDSYYRSASPNSLITLLDEEVKAAYPGTSTMEELYGAIQLLSPRIQ